ncbi:MAG: FHA domain-containing protein [Phycisphaeraceae bacterium]
MLILIIAGGPDKGRIYELNNDAPIVLGREGDQVKLNDRKVSREHARLWCEGGQWYLEDLGSRHGTYRNHAPLEKDQRAKLKDGDYLQIGNTVMVLGRMPAEHAEKLSLLAAQSGRDTSAARRPILIAGGVSVAALLALGTFVAIELNALRGETVPRDEFAKLQQQLLSSQEQQAERIEQSFDQQSGTTRELLDHQRQLVNSLDQTNQSINRHSTQVADAADAMRDAADPILNKLDNVNAVATRQQLAIERLGEMLAHQQANDATPNVLAAVNEMKALLADQPRGDALVARLEAAIKTNAEAAGEAVRLALAEHAKSNPGGALATREDTEALLGKILEQLANVPTREQIAAEVRLAVAESTAENEQFMRLVLAELRRTGDQITTDVAAAIDEDTGQALQLATELRALDNESAARTASMLEQLLKKVDDQKALSTQITTLREQIESLPGRDDEAVKQVLSRLDEQDRNNTALLENIADLRAAMPEDLPGRLDQVLAQLDKQVRTEQITDVIEQSMQRLAASREQETEAALARLTQRIEALPTAEELDQIADSQQALARLLDQSDAGEAIGQLRASLEQLSSQLPGAKDDKLSRVIDMLEQREKADLLLAELHDEVGEQSGKTDALKQELLAAINASRDDETNEALDELLGLVRDRLATDDSVRQAIRDEVRGTLLPNQRALSDAREVSTSSNAASQGDASAGEQPALPSRRLTGLERAYKRSFDTGEPVTVGAGVVDPETGKVSEGRVIDPAVAKALGFENWRDWYLSDRHAEQMRLQQEAIRQRNENAAQDPDTVELPAIRPGSDSGRPEQG